MRKGKEDEAIKGSFEKLNEEQILQKIGRINKLNSEINGRLQKILTRVTYNEWLICSDFYFYMLITNTQSLYTFLVALSTMLV